TLVAVVVIVPVVYIFGMAFSNIRTAIPNQIWPDEPNFEAFRYLFGETNFKIWYLNTLSIALINMIVGTLLITGAAYVFARFSFKGKKAGLLTILVLQAFPSFMGLIAMYVLFWKFHLLGQPRALSILYIGGSIPGNLWLIKGFLSQIPKDLDESAMIDGASKFQIFWKIILPLSVPILTFVAVSMFMGPWMDYLLPGFLLRFKPEWAGPTYDITQQWTLAIGLFRFINDPNYRHYSAFAAGALLVGIPITALYMAFQRYLIEGIMAGATKG
ncbi:MAG: sugar ABC transporter permease, partial [Acholeplasmataceae bacterium]|nr:sugar ABC transporter permease [Acholeplasmataceae bacterium]